MAISAMVFALLIMSSKLAPASSSASACPPASGMTQQSGPPSGKWYLLLPDAVTFAGAASACSALGLQMARVATAADYGNVVGYLEDSVAANGESAWLDLTNPSQSICYSTSECDGLLEDASGNNVGTSHMADLTMLLVPLWASQNCVSLSVRGGTGAGMTHYAQSRNCNNLVRPLCESDCGAQGTSCPAPPSSAVLVGTKYYLGGSSQTLFASATSHCQGLGMSGLASVSTQEDYDNVRFFNDGNGMEEDIWVDLHNPSNTQDCDSASDCNLLLETLGGAKVQTTYWTEVDFKDMKSKVKDDECVYFSETSKSDLKSADCSKDSKYPLCGHDCGVDGGWTTWSSGSAACSVTCGIGARTESRACTNPVPVAPGGTCTGPETRTVQCDTGIFCQACPPIFDDATQLDPHFIATSPALTWSEGHTWCVDHGMEMLPLNTAGKVAAAKFAALDNVWIDVQHTTSSANCDNSGAVCHDTMDLQRADGSWTLTRHVPRIKADQSGVNACFYFGANNGGTAYDTSCSSVRGAACYIQCGVLTCPENYPHAFNSGSTCCDTDADCSPSLAFSYAGSCCKGSSANCVATDGGKLCQSALVNGGWSEWVNGTCSVSCGPGTMGQTRTCDSPAKANGGQDCVGSDSDTVPCDDGSCAGPINGGWTVWLPTTTCSESCGPGFLNESRSCTNPVPQNGGDNCVGDTEREISCEITPCPIDGGWTVWIPSTACSEPCGPGFLNESRSCTNPVPQNGGDDCSGDSERVTSCEITPCSIDGGFCNWTNDTCSVTCGGLGLGLLTQTRTCDCPTPQHGGANCSGDWSQTTNIDCGVGECPPEWSIWGSWSACSKTCDYGVETRDRACSQPGGCPGLGPSVEARYCNSTACPGTTYGTKMFKYRVSLTARDEFLSSATSIPVANGLQPSIFCTHKCLRRRSDRLDTQSCNGFIYEDGLCKLGYMDPTWIYQQAQNPGTETEIAFDVQFT